MTQVPSPRASRLRQARWTDVRFLGGVLLVLASVVLGARVVGAADRSTLVYAARRALPPGYQLGAGDLVPSRVRLFGQSLADRYVAVGREPVGYVVLRDVLPGELVPRSAIATPDGAPPVRYVSVAVDRAHALGGDVEVGDRVDILATYGGAGQPSVTRVVAAGVAVVRRPKDASGFAGSAGDFAIVVAVSPQQAVALTAALRTAKIDVLKVVPGRGGAGRVDPTAQASPR
ncbi:MAG: RcpC/CpaB family pilus assembly protein [Mycobacteriales bacterium]|nr:hypothetical protein [Frankia sp.]